MNYLAAVIILLNILVMFGCYFAFFNTSDPQNLPMLVGTLYGAVTNTPGLGTKRKPFLGLLGRSFLFLL